MPMQLDDDPEGLIEAFEQIAELPDLWDITVRDYRYEMGSSRFVKEAANQAAVAKVKSMTSKPVVSVGRFTSPDTMLSQVVNGTQDFIGAARPSIADPFLPQKIDQGRVDDIRECIGCNVCYAHDSLCVPIRCTQNPTMGEEWRRGWHPDRIESRHADESVLVVGSGPAGLEAACALGQRGYPVILAEAEQELGGRINRESRLPGLSEYARVRDWRLGQLAKMEKVQIYPDNRLDVEAVLELGNQHVILATGARWRSDGVGRYSNQAFKGFDQPGVIGVESILNGELPDGDVVIYDDEHYYLGSAIALKLSATGANVTMVTPESSLAGWSHNTEEHSLTMQVLIEAGVEIITARGLVNYKPGEVELECVFSGRQSKIQVDVLIPVSARAPDDELWRQLELRRDEFDARGGLSMQRIGDCRAPGIVAAAVYAGHKAARELGQQEPAFKRDRVVV
jgi:dimethylamine/trimethylamine dehydrogenase